MKIYARKISHTFYTKCSKDKEPAIYCSLPELLDCSYFCLSKINYFIQLNLIE